MPQLLDHDVGPIGYGLQWLTFSHDVPPQEQAFACLRAAAEAGCLVWDGGETYGPREYNSLVLLRRFFDAYPEYRDRVILNIKGAISPEWIPQCSRRCVRESIENCVEQLGGVTGKTIDMFECARVDPKVDLGETLAEMERCADEGFIWSLAMSEVTGRTIKEAVRCVKIKAVEIELSLWCVNALRDGTLKACAEEGITVLAYCPLGRGMLTGSLQSTADLAQNDIRKWFPRFHPGNFEKNLKLVQEIQKLADKKKCSPAQFALGWLLTLSKQPGMPLIIPIPGATSVEHIQENAKTFELTTAEMEAVDELIRLYPPSGKRYAPQYQKYASL